jgi:iron(III) transport system substrate-binding protein
VSDVASPSTNNIRQAQTMTAPRSTSGFLSLLAALVAVLLVVAGCGGAKASGPVSDRTPFADVEAAAKKEGTLTWYSGASPAQLQPTADAFKARYGITVNLVRITTGQLTTRYSSEAQSGKIVADVVQQSDEKFAQQAASNAWIAPLTPALLPAMADWPADLQHGSYLSLETIPWGLDYNASTVGAPPADYTDLLDPRFTGKILMLDPRALPASQAFFYFLNEKYGPDFMTKLAAQSPKVYPSSVPGLQALAAGEGTVFFPCPPGTDADLVAQGAPLEHVTPPATTGFDQFLLVSQNAPHPNAARLFANFMLTPEGQNLLTNGAAVSPLGSAAVPRSLARPDGLVHPDGTVVAQTATSINDVLGVR